MYKLRLNKFAILVADNSLIPYIDNRLDSKDLSDDMYATVVVDWVKVSEKVYHALIEYYYDNFNCEPTKLKILPQNVTKNNTGKHSITFPDEFIMFLPSKKLTEKEIDSISYLFSMKKPVNVQELQQKVWGYKSDSETHTVETHIYRLRKKILKEFNDAQFIKSTASGYQIT